MKLFKNRIFLKLSKIRNVQVSGKKYSDYFPNASTTKPVSRDKTGAKCIRKKEITAEHSRPINIGVASNQRDRGSCFPQERTPNRPTQFMRSIAAVDGPRNSRIIYLSLAGSIQCCIWGIVDGGDLYKSETL